MNSIIISILLLGNYYSLDNMLSKEANKSTNNEKSIIINQNNIAEEPYNIKLQIYKVKNNQYRLEVKMDLAEGSYFVSPHSKGSYKGIFNISIEGKNKLSTNGNLLEVPRSVEQIDPWKNSLASIVNENTTYKQTFTIVPQNDFEVTGLVRFVIEPRCTLEEVKFIISYYSGELKIKKTV